MKYSSSKLKALLKGNQSMYSQPILAVHIVGQRSGKGLPEVLPIDGDFSDGDVLVMRRSKVTEHWVQAGNLYN